MPKISVITGYYNRVGYLERTIQSILHQSMADLELIVFDDHSTDTTAERLLALKEELNDDRLVVHLHDRNIGFTAGLIAAINSSSGEYIAIQGSGDVSLPTRLEKQASILDGNPSIGMVGCQFTEISLMASGEHRIQRYTDAEGLTLGRLLKRNTYFSHGDVMYRRSAYLAVGGYRSAFHSSQDYDLWLRIIRAYKVTTVKESLYERYVIDGGVSHSPKKLVQQERYNVLARQMALSDAADGKRLYEELERRGPEALVPLEHPEVQRRAMRAAIRALERGDVANAHLLINQYLTQWYARMTFRLISTLMAYGRGSESLTVVRRLYLRFAAGGRLSL